MNKLYKISNKLFNNMYMKKCEINRKIIIYIVIRS